MMNNMIFLVYLVFSVITYIILKFKLSDFLDRYMIENIFLIRNRASFAKEVRLLLMCFTPILNIFVIFLTLFAWGIVEEPLRKSMANNIAQQIYGRFRK